MPVETPPLEKFASCRLPTELGEFELAVWRSGELEVVTLARGELNGDEPLFVRIHSQCFTSEVFGSLRCDCREQLDYAQNLIGQRGRGLIIYLQQEGRGIGLANKVRAYALQDAGADTLEANHRLGFAGDLRDFSTAGLLLQQLGVRQIDLHTNNPEKIAAVEDAGIKVHHIVPSLTPPTPHNARYLQTKAEAMGHSALRALDYSPFAASRPDESAEQ